MGFHPAQAMRLVADSRGRIWYSDGSGRPRRHYGLLPDLTGRKTGPIGLVGHVDQISLLDAVLAERPQDVWVASARSVGAGPPAYSPVAALRGTAAVHLASSVGGWARVSPGQEAVIAASAQDDPGRLAGHPVMARLAFVHGLDPVATRSLLVRIVDPRWYLDHDHPDGRGPYMSRLGLSPRQAGTPAEVRTSECWEKGLLGDVSAPGAFVQRRYLEVIRDRGDGILARIKAGQTFAKFLYAVWTALLYEGREEVFVPEYFLKPVEALAYRRHVAGLLPPVDAIGASD